MRGLGGEGLDLALPSVFERAFDAGHIDLAFGDVDQAAALQQLVHDRTDPLHLCDLVLGRHAPGVLVGLWRDLGGENRVTGPGGEVHVGEEPAHLADRLAPLSR